MTLKTKYPNLRQNIGTTRHVARFVGLEGKNTILWGKIFVLLFVENKFYWAPQNLGGDKKDVEVTAPECPRACGPGNWVANHCHLIDGDNSEMLQWNANAKRICRKSESILWFSYENIIAKGANM